jgi:hypothetical protein
VVPSAAFSRPETYAFDFFGLRRFLFLDGFVSLFVCGDGEVVAGGGDNEDGAGVVTVVVVGVLAVCCVWLWLSGREVGTGSVCVFVWGYSLGWVGLSIFLLVSFCLDRDDFPIRVGGSTSLCDCLPIWAGWSTSIYDCFPIRVGGSTTLCDCFPVRVGMSAFFRSCHDGRASCCHGETLCPVSLSHLIAIDIGVDFGGGVGDGFVGGGGVFFFCVSLAWFGLVWVGWVGSVGPVECLLVFLRDLVLCLGDCRVFRP